MVTTQRDPCRIRPGSHSRLCPCEPAGRVWPIHYLCCHQRRCHTGRAHGRRRVHCEFAVGCVAFFGSTLSRLRCPSWSTWRPSAPLSLRRFHGGGWSLRTDCVPSSYRKEACNVSRIQASPPMSLPVVSSSGFALLADRHWKQSEPSQS